MNETTSPVKIGPLRFDSYEMYNSLGTDDGSTSGNTSAGTQR